MGRAKSQPEKEAFKTEGIKEGFIETFALSL